MIELLVNIDVDDLEKAVHFYTAALGLIVGRRFGEGAVEMLGGSLPIYLLKKPGGSRPFADAPSVRDYRRHWTPVHIDLVVQDLEAALRRAEAAGGRVERGIEQHAWGRIAVLADPFGHGFCILQFSGRGYDEIADRPSEPSAHACCR